MCVQTNDIKIQCEEKCKIILKHKCQYHNSFAKFNCFTKKLAREFV